jgi:ethanolamine utilization protein EutQ (cupin superfamily)
MEKLETLSFDQPTEVRTFDKGRVELVTLDGHPVMRTRLDPGWRWSECVKPIAQTDWCEVTHMGYMVSGRMTIRMSDGEERTFGPGDVAFIPAGHDAWVVGDQTVVFVDFQGAPNYAREHEHAFA